MTTKTAIDLDARYTIAGWAKGIAFYIVGPELVDEYDDETGENVTEWSGIQLETGQLRAVMVGDDAVHIVDPEDLTRLGEDDYCHECGQIGCTADGRDRD